MSSFYHKFSECIESPGDFDPRPIVFIDSRINQWDDLVQQATPEVRVFVLGLLTDGTKAITRILNSSLCREVYLVSTGIPGCLYLGSDELSRNTIIEYEQTLRTWFNNIDVDSDDPQINIYGCNVAAGDVGSEFLTKLNSLTKAEISASVNVYSCNIFR